VAKWHNSEIRQAKEMCFDGTMTIRFFSKGRGAMNGNSASYKVAVSVKTILHPDMDDGRR
jgi:hypothetical protein